MRSCSESQNGHVAAPPFPFGGSLVEADAMRSIHTPHVLHSNSNSAPPPACVPCPCLLSSSCRLPPPVPAAFPFPDIKFVSSPTTDSPNQPAFFHCLPPLPSHLASHHHHLFLLHYAVPSTLFRLVLGLDPNCHTVKPTHVAREPELQPSVSHTIGPCQHSNHFHRHRASTTTLEDFGPESIRLEVACNSVLCCSSTIPRPLQPVFKIPGRHLQPAPSSPTGSVSSWIYSPSFLTNSQPCTASIVPTRHPPPWEGNQSQQSQEHRQQQLQGVPGQGTGWSLW